MLPFICSASSLCSIVLFSCFGFSLYLFKCKQGLLAGVPNYIENTSHIIIWILLLFHSLSVGPWILSLILFFSHANLLLFLISFCDMTLCFTPFFFFSLCWLTVHRNSWINLLVTIYLVDSASYVFLLADDDSSEGRKMLQMKFDRKCSLFYVELPGGTILYHLVDENEKFPTQFGREVDIHARIRTSASRLIIFMFCWVRLGLLGSQ